MYGARAMNGVVVITTKKGHAGKPAINYSANFSTYLKPNYSEFNIMNSGQQMSVLAQQEEAMGDVHRRDVRYMRPRHNVLHGPRRAAR